MCVRCSRGAPSVVHPCVCVCVCECETQEQGSWGLCCGGGGLFSGDPEVKALGPFQAGVTVNLTSSTQFKTSSILDS